MRFKSEFEIFKWLVDGGKVEHDYTSVVFFFKDGRLESGITKDPNYNFSDFQRYMKYSE